MKGELADFAMGMVGVVVFVLAYTNSPAVTIGLIGFHIGVVTMRTSRGYWVKAAPNKI